MIEFEQALHGYEGGHRLLASSVELARADRRLLARQTDSPDAGRVAGWDALLAGHPLPSGRFALSMTWPATEMPRPGCVWTHTLILDQQAIAAASSALVSFFRRPLGPDPATDAYRTAVRATVPAPATLVPEASRWSEALAWSFYEPPERPVRVLRMALPDRERHDLLASLWAVAWPELRAVLSFCDAPRTHRPFDERPFDLQLHHASHMSQAEASEARVLRGLPEASPPGWSKRLAKEMVRPSGLSKLLAEYGPTLDTSRTGMRPLVRLFGAYSTKETGGSRRAEAVISVLTDEFPEARAAAKLKQDVLSPKHAPASLERLEDVPLLRTLVTTEAHEAFRDTNLAVAERIERLYAEDITGLGDVLTSIEYAKQPIADKVLSAAIAVGSADGFSKWVKRDAKPLGRLARLKPEILQQPDVWEAADTETLWAVAAKKRGTAQRRAIARAAIQADATVDPEAMVKSWGNGSEVILDALAQDTKLSTNKLARWLGPVSTENILDFLSTEAEVSGAFAAAALRSMEPVDIIKLDATTVGAALEAVCSIDLAIAVFLAALEAPFDAKWAEIATLSYCRVTGPAGKDELREARRRLEGVEPDLPKHDVAARVARAANRAFKSGRWPIEAALLINDRKAFTALVQADKHAGLARAILLHITQSNTKVAVWQREVISSTIRDRSDRESLLKTIEELARGIFRS